MSTHDAVKIGLVSTSDRAAQGVYRDEGIPALDMVPVAPAVEIEPDRLIVDEAFAE